MFFSLDTRCTRTKHNCGKVNPCSPLCDENTTRYPGIRKSRYVQCYPDGGCGVVLCAPGETFNPHTASCDA